MKMRQTYKQYVNKNQMICKNNSVKKNLNYESNKINDR